ncbi:uncharacterized protein UHOD_20564 [Ustilago sp. UG-2017b]|nr:uncharacterized protein UHOD_20564 [Ustilago sp. UG-2017b]
MVCASELDRTHRNPLNWLCLLCFAPHSSHLPAITFSFRQVSLQDQPCQSFFSFHLGRYCLQAFSFSSSMTASQTCSSCSLSLLHQPAQLPLCALHCLPAHPASAVSAAVCLKPGIYWKSCF